MASDKKSTKLGQIAITVATSVGAALTGDVASEIQKNYGKYSAQDARDRRDEEVRLAAEREKKK